MFEAEIFRLSSSTLWSFSQTLITPTLGFLFLYLLRLPLSELYFLPKKTEYQPPAWVLPLFAHVSTFLLVACASATLFLERMHQRALAHAVEPELFLTRHIDLAGKQPAKVSAVVRSYDGLSTLKLLANGYHAFGTDRDCMASFQCTPDHAKASRDAEAFRVLRKSGGSLYEFNRTNSLPHEILLNHYLSGGQNYVDVISANSGSGWCEATIDITIETAQGQRNSHEIRIHPHRAPNGNVATVKQSALPQQEMFYSGGPARGHRIANYNTSAIERQNVVCERIRIVLPLTDQQAQQLSRQLDFESHFLARQKAFVCETVGKPIPGCG